MSTVRLRRLGADFDKLKDYTRRHPRVSLVEFDGDPPERYALEFKIRSLRQVGDDIQVVQGHKVEIVLPRNYPRVAPQCRMLSPVFHPNIAPHAICVGDHWSPGESLESLVVRIGEMLAFQSYNVKSPLNGEAARWVEQNEDQLPIDRVSLLAEERQPRRSGGSAAGKAQAPAAPVAKRPAPKPEAPVERQPVAKAPLAEDEPAKISAACTSCGTKYKVLADHRGKTVRCKACEQSFVIQ